MQHPARGLAAQGVYGFNDGLQSCRAGKNFHTGETKIPYGRNKIFIRQQAKFHTGEKVFSSARKITSVREKKYFHTAAKTHYYQRYNSQILIGDFKLFFRLIAAVIQQYMRLAVQ